MGRLGRTAIGVMLNGVGHTSGKRPAQIVNSNGAHMPTCPRYHVDTRTVAMHTVDMHRASSSPAGRQHR